MVESQIEVVFEQKYKAKDSQFKKGNQNKPEK